MRAMAILFIGPHRNPDFAADYHLSPVLAPSHLLAQFPPLIMSCGEKDPFVDDTVIFAGRVREAKRVRRRELEQTLVGRSAKYGEALRMTLSSDVGRDDMSLRALKREFTELKAQTEEDWVQLHIFSDWSHGYMQMAALMEEARTVINDLADRIDDVFAARRDSRRGNVGAHTDGARKYRLGAPSVKSASTPLTSETEMETETDDPLTFAPKRRSPPPSVSNGTRERIVGRARSRSRTPQSSSRNAVDKRGGGGPDRSPNSEITGSLESPNASAHHPASIPLDLQHRTEGAALVTAMPANGLAAGQTSAAYASGSLSSTPPVSGVKTPAKAGQTITESELMRRRRLLDSHLIPSDSSRMADGP